MDSTAGTFCYLNKAATEHIVADNFVFQ